MCWGQTGDDLVGDSGHHFGNGGTGLLGIGGGREVVHDGWCIEYSSETIKVFEVLENNHVWLTNLSVK